MLGHPMLLGEDYLALSQDDLLARWHPNTAGQFVTIAHPATGTPEPDLTPVASFGGYPMAETSSGPVVADDQISPFIAVFRNPVDPLWHRDILNRLGVPAVQRDVVYTNVGGEDALNAIVALDSKTGETLWQFAPNTFGQEPAELLATEKMRAATRLETEVYNAARAIQRGKRSAFQSSEKAPAVHLGQETPVIDGRHGHWMNPGLVTAKGNVYGEVGNSIVALSQSTGKVVWKYDLEIGETARSIAGSANYLFVSLDKQLIAIDLETGKMEFKQEMPRAGTITIANGYVFVAMTPAEATTEGGELVAFTAGEKQGDQVKPTTIPPP